MNHPSIIQPSTEAQDLANRRREYQAIRYHMRQGMTEDEARAKATMPKGICQDCGAPAHTEKARVCAKCRSKRSNDSYARKRQATERRTKGTGLSAHQAAALASPAKRKPHRTGKGAEPFRDPFCDPERPLPSDYRPPVTTTTRVENGVVVQRISVARREGLRDLFNGVCAVEDDEIDVARHRQIEAIRQRVKGGRG